jgi:DNA (cytosine-5)-methyltransferase 1
MKKIKINHLDLFSGIGGFHLGFERAGFKINSYFSEIDKYAIQVYKDKFKDSNYVGSVTDVRGGDLPNIDLITFGSPCQDFSLAGKRKGLGGERSSLISEAIRLIREKRPRVFVWENVKGTFSSNNRQDFAAILQAFTNIGGYRLEWQLLNTKWFLPQNRERIYLVGYLGDGSGGQIFPIGESSKQINELQGQQGNTCTLTTRYGADGNGSYIIERKLDAQEVEIIDKRGNIKADQNNIPTVVAGYHKHPSDSPYLEIKTNNLKGYEVAEEGDSINYSVPNSKTRRGRVGKGVAQTLDTACNQAVIGAMRGRNPENPSDRTTGSPTEQRLEINQNGTSNTLTSVGKDNLVVSNKIRRLTPIECERLQGFPDDWTKQGTEGMISDTQRYKMCGNAVTVDVVEAVAERIKQVVYA